MVFYDLLNIALKTYTPFPLPERTYITRDEKERWDIFVLFENIYILFCIVLYGEEDLVFGITRLRKKCDMYKKVCVNHEIVICNSVEQTR